MRLRVGGPHGIEQEDLPLLEGAEEPHEEGVARSRRRSRPPSRSRWRGPTGQGRARTGGRRRKGSSGACRGFPRRAPARAGVQPPARGPLSRWTKRPRPWMTGTSRLADRNHRKPQRPNAAAATSARESTLPAAIQPAWIQPRWTAAASRATALKGRPTTNAAIAMASAAPVSARRPGSRMCRMSGQGARNAAGRPAASTSKPEEASTAAPVQNTRLGRLQVVASVGPGHRVLHPDAQAEVHEVQDDHDAEERDPESVRLGAEVVEREGHLGERAHARDGLRAERRGDGEPYRPLAAKDVGWSRSGHAGPR